MVTEDTSRELNDLESTESDDESVADQVDEDVETDEAEDADESGEDGELYEEDMFDFEDEEDDADAVSNEEEDSEEACGEDAEAAADEAGTEKAEVPEEVAPKSADAEFYETITQIAMDRVKAITGEEYDEFDPKHKIILMREADKVAEHVEKDRSAKSEASQIIEQAGGEKFSAFLRDKMQDVTKREYDAMIAAEQNGDYSKTLAFMKRAAQEFKVGDKVKAKIAAVNTASGAHRSNPPQTMGSGTGSTPKAKRRADVFSLEDLGIK
jgi:hypothetical protein